MARFLRLAAIAAMAIAASASSATPKAPVGDSDTAKWWAATAELANDSLAGRDTGSADYDRAAAIVARHFASSGLKPVGENGGWFQPIAFDDFRVLPAGSRISLGGHTLVLNREILLQPGPDTPRRLAAPATFRGYCGPSDISSVRGKLVICYGRPTPARIGKFDRLAALHKAGAAGMLLIAAPGLASEPIRWPFAYSRSVAFAGLTPPAAKPFLTGILNPASLARIMPGGARVLARGKAGADLPSRNLGRFSATLAIAHSSTHSANILGLLPGTDPALADQVVVVSAHLDGYGHGQPVNGDSIYNGTLDDAAYVALLEQLAARRAGHGYRRPVLFAVFTGEEKGLLGSTWFVEHPTIPKSSLVADINLDQVRPLYPLKLLIVHGLVESTLGEKARMVAGKQGIRVEQDPNPERNLVRRGDNWPFMNAHIPALSFVFATYDASSLARYRDWYEHRYHHPADDLSTPIDWEAAGAFNRFFYGLTESIADAAQRPEWMPGNDMPQDNK